MKYFVHLRWFIPVMLVGYSLWQIFFSTVPSVGVTNFLTPTPYFDVLLPPSRVARVPKGAALQQEPVYVDVHLPVRVISLELELAVTPDSAPLRLGVQPGVDFNLVFPDVAVLKTSEAQIYRLKVTDFTHLRPRHTLRFVLSAPGLVPGSVVVRGAKVRFERGLFHFTSL